MALDLQWNGYDLRDDSNLAVRHSDFSSFYTAADCFCLNL